MIAVLAICCLTAIALKTHIDSTSAIAAVAIGLAASNSAQKVGERFKASKVSAAEKASEAAEQEP